MLVKEIQNIDIGKLHDISELCRNMESLNEMCRMPAEFILYLAKFYLKVNNWREDKLKTFKSLKQKDHESFLFAIAIGGDGAPGIGMSVLVSFINVGEQLPSRKEQFLLLSGDVDEGSQVVQNSFKPFVKDLNYLESKVFEIDTGNEKKKVEFMMTELPNDMKMLSFLAGELSNSASYFSTFASVARNEANNYKKSFGLGSEHFWKLFPYLKRMDDVRKVEHKRTQLSSNNILPSAVHNESLAFIAKEIGSRQYQFPLVGKNIDVAKAEPLHLKKNTIKE